MLRRLPHQRVDEAVRAPALRRAPGAVPATPARVDRPGPHAPAARSRGLPRRALASAPPGWGGPSPSASAREVGRRLPPPPPPGRSARFLAVTSPGLRAPGPPPPPPACSVGARALAQRAASAYRRAGRSAATPERSSPVRVSRSHLFSAELRRSAQCRLLGRAARGEQGSLHHRPRQAVERSDHQGSERLAPARDGRVLERPVLHGRHGLDERRRVQRPAHLAEAHRRGRRLPNLRPRSPLHVPLDVLQPSAGEGNRQGAKSAKARGFFGVQAGVPKKILGGLGPWRFNPLVCAVTWSWRWCDRGRISGGCVGSAAVARGGRSSLARGHAQRGGAAQRAGDCQRAARECVAAGHRAGRSQVALVLCQARTGLRRAMDRRGARSLDLPGRAQLRLRRARSVSMRPSIKMHRAGCRFGTSSSAATDPTATAVSKTPKTSPPIRSSSQALRLRWWTRE